MSGIFVSYRREDTAPYAGRLGDALRYEFDQDTIFRDIDTIRPGAEFHRVIEDAVGSCEVFLALIGRRWLTAKDENRARRLDDPDDYVRLEIASALRRPDLLVIPVLVENARMPAPEKLPADIAGLARRNALRLSDVGWRDELENLIEAIRPALAPAPAPAPPPPSRPSPPPSAPPRASPPSPPGVPPPPAAPPPAAPPPSVRSTGSPDVRRHGWTGIAIGAVVTLAVLLLIGVLVGGGGGGAGDDHAGNGGTSGTNRTVAGLQLVYNAEPLSPDQLADGNTHQVTIHLESPDGELPPITEVVYKVPETGDTGIGNPDDRYSVTFPAAGTFDVVAEVHLEDGSVQEVPTTVSV